MTNFSNFEKKLGRKKNNIQQNIVLSKKTIVKWQIFTKEKNAALTCQKKTWTAEIAIKSILDLQEIPLGTWWPGNK